MKILVMTDTHFRTYGNRLVNGLNEFFFKQITIFDEIIDKESPDIVIFCGDLFDKRYKLDVVVSYFVSKVINKYTRKGVKFYFLVGNHDLYRMSFINSIEVVSGLNRVFKKRKVIDINGDSFVFLPYIKEINSKEDLKSVKKFLRKNDGYLFVHNYIDVFNRIENGNEVDFTNADEYVISEEDISHYEYVFSGHNHLHQEKGNLRNIGSLFYLKWSEVGERGYYVLDEDKVMFRESESFRFITYRFEDNFDLEEDLDFNDYDYYRFIVKEDLVDSLLKKYDRRKVSFNLMDIIVEYKAEENEQNEVVNMNYDYEEAIEEFVKYKKKDKVFIEKGLEVLNEVLGD